MSGRGRRPRRLLVAAALAAAALLALDRLFPPPLPEAERFGAEVLDREGLPLHVLPAADRHWRLRASLERVSPLYLEALLALEDRRFRLHPGVDPLAVLRAAWQNLRAGRVVSGASTLSMQTARLLEPMPRGLLGKLRQSLRALQLEWWLSKDEILELYLAFAPFGGNLSGLRAASLAYLGKEPERLSHAEAALLAVLPKAPSRLRPDRHPEAARAARDRLLARLAAEGIWPAETAARALAEPVPAQRRPFPREAARLAEAIATPGQAVRSTLDRELQRRSDALLASRLAQSAPGLAGAVVVLDHRAGEILAYATGLHPGSDQGFWLDHARRLRSPGSALKPFLYALAIEEGLIHPQSLLVDAPLSLDAYRPGNFDRRFRGAVSASEALAASLNTPAVDLLLRIGPARFAARLAHAGLPLRLPAGERPAPGMILGGVETRLLELVAAYGAFGNGGVAMPWRARRDEAPVPRRLFEPRAAWLTWHILAAGEEGFAFKTGTSHSFRDAWALGVNGRIALGVWLGRPDGAPVAGLEGSVALALARTIAASLPPGLRGAPPRPPGIVEETVCWPLGRPPAETPPGLCHRIRRGLAIAGRLPPTLPERLAPRLGARIETALVDRGTGLRVDPGCSPDPAPARLLLARWPARALPWLDPELRRRSSPPPWSPGCVGQAGGRLAIEGVAPESRVTGPELGGGARLTVRALGAEERVIWLLDGLPAGLSHPGEPIAIALGAPGRKSLLAIDRAGRVARVDFSFLGLAARQGGP